MAIEQDLQTALDDYSALSALVGSRNYISKLPQDPSYPNTVTTITREIVNTLSGESGLEHIEAQIDVRALTYSESRAVVIQVKAAIAASTAFTSICLFDEDLNFEESIDTFRTVIRFSIWQ